MNTNLGYYLDVLKYDIFKLPNYFDYSIIPTSLTFKSNYDKNQDLHYLEINELPWTYVTGHDKLELAKNIGDTLLVYYDVPTYFAKKWRPESTTFNFENAKTGEQEYVSLDYEEELRKATA